MVPPVIAVIWFGLLAQFFDRLPRFVSVRRVGRVRFEYYALSVSRTENNSNLNLYVCIDRVRVSRAFRFPGDLIPVC